MDNKKELMKGRLIEMTQRISAPAERVWQAWADPARISQWFVDRAEGGLIPGTTYKLSWDKFNFTVPYKVEEAEPGKLLTLSAPTPHGRLGISELVFEQDGEETIVRMVNAGFKDGAEWEDEYQGIVSGWHGTFAVLKLYVERYFGKPKQGITALRPAPFEFGAVYPWLASGERRKRWLAPFGPQEPAEVMALTNREVLLRWPEIEGEIELKAFAWGGGTRMLGLRVISWSDDSQGLAQREGEANEALGRLAALLS